MVRDVHKWRFLDRSVLLCSGVSVWQVGPFLPAALVPEPTGGHRGRPADGHTESVHNQVRTDLPARGVLHMFVST